MLMLGSRRLVSTVQGSERRYHGISPTSWARADNERQRKVKVLVSMVSP